MKRRGQSLVITVLIMLVLVLAVFFTFTVGERVRQKTTAQAAADAAAYSNAVIEARSFNFYAFSNRAMVSHAVAATSVIAHQSYLSYYEDALVTTAVMYQGIAARLDTACRLRSGTGVSSCGALAVCAAANRADDVYRLYAFGMPTLAGRVFDHNPNLSFITGGWVWTESGGNPVRTTVGAIAPIADQDREGVQCQGDRDCDIKPKGPRGGLWFHDQYHSKADGNWCDLLGDAERDEVSAIQLLRAHQLDVQDEVLALLGDASAKQLDLKKMRDDLPKGGDRTTGGDDPAPRFIDIHDYESNSTLRGSAAQQLVKRFDARLEVEDKALKLTREEYSDAIFEQRPDSFAHRDYDQVLYATRYPEWIVHRTNGVVNDDNWKTLQRLANALAGGDRVETFVTNAGNAGAVGSPSIPNGPTRSSETTWTGNPLYLAPTPGSSAGYRLADMLHEETVPTLHAMGAEDHGRVTARYIIGGCGEVVASPWPLEDARDGIFDSGNDAPGYHGFHGHTAAVNGHNVGPGHRVPLYDYAYLGHMRFLAKPEEPLLNQPRVIIEVKRPERTSARPWDFDIAGAFAVRGRVTSKGTLGTTSVAASAGALVYFHHPDDGAGPGSQEPPNFWSPFWRAKLHPLRVEDAAEVDRDLNSLRTEVPLREMLP